MPNTRAPFSSLTAMQCRREAARLRYYAGSLRILAGALSSFGEPKLATDALARAERFDDGADVYERAANRLEQAK